MNFAVQLRASFLLSLVLCASAFAQSAQPNPAGSAFKYTSFQVPGSTYTVALGVNNKGAIVGSAVSNGVQSGFLYAGGKFKTIACPGGTFTIAQGINDSGVVAGWCGLKASTQAFIYQNGKYSLVAYPGASLTALNGINDQGLAAGVYQVNGKQFAFVYSAGAFKSLSGSRLRFLGGINNANTLSGAGCNPSCGLIYTQSPTTKKWSLSQMVKYPGAKATAIYSLNDNGDLVGAWGPTPSGQQQGFVFVKSTSSFTGLNIKNSGDMAATGINNTGMIVGYSTVGSKFFGFYGSVQ